MRWGFELRHTPASAVKPFGNCQSFSVVSFLDVANSIFSFDSVTLFNIRSLFHSRNTRA